jgi:hypothetical protein
LSHPAAYLRHPFLTNEAGKNFWSCEMLLPAAYLRHSFVTQGAGKKHLDQKKNWSKNENRTKSKCFLEMSHPLFKRRTPKRRCEIGSQGSKIRISGCTHIPQVALSCGMSLSAGYPRQMFLAAPMETGPQKHLEQKGF